MTKKEKYITRRCYIIVVVVVVRDAHNLKPALYFLILIVKYIEKEEIGYFIDFIETFFLYRSTKNENISMIVSS